VSVVEQQLVGAQTPRIARVPEYTSSAAEEAIEVADTAGLVLDPWQRLTLTHALGETPAGRWAAYEVGLCVSRQSGKGTIQEARELAGLFSFGEQLIIHSAHEQATSSEHFRRIVNLIEGVPEFDRRVLKVSRGKGAEAIELRGGQRIFFKTRTNGGGRGLTGDVVILDEAMILPPSIMATLVPTMSARSMVGNPQLWYAGSAVDQLKHLDGHYFARVRERGISGDRAKRLCYLEWSAEGDDPETVSDEVLASPAQWAMANPGLGIRISVDHIAAEHDALGRREFAVERLGIGDWPSADDNHSVLDVDVWRSLEDEDSKPVESLCFAFDVTPARSAAAICVAGYRDDGLPHVEYIRHEPGTRWVVDAIVDLAGRHDAVAIVCDQASPAMSFVKQIENAGVTVKTVSGPENAQACGQFFDAVADERLRHIGQPELLTAVRGATKRQLGDAWAWSRRSSQADISPLVAATLALWGAANTTPDPGFFFEVFS
jgi:hypothetical protein